MSFRCVLLLFLVAELCDGVSLQCPVDTFAAAQKVCRRRLLAPQLMFAPLVVADLSSATRRLRRGRGVHGHQVSAVSAVSVWLCSRRRNSAFCPVDALLGVGAECRASRGPCGSIDRRSPLCITNVTSARCARVLCRRRARLSRRQATHNGAILTRRRLKFLSSFVPNTSARRVSCRREALR